MGLLDDAIREHLDLKRRRGADPAEVERAEREALGPVRRGPEEPEPSPPADTASVFDEQGDTEWADPERFTEPAGPDHIPSRVVEPEAGGPEFGEGPPTELHDPFADEPEPFETQQHEPRQFESDRYEAEPEPLALEQQPRRRGFLGRRKQRDAPPEPEDHADLLDQDDDPFAEPPEAAVPPPHPAAGAPPPQGARGGDTGGGETVEYEVEAAFEAERQPEGDDLLEETPEFLEDTPDHDRLWFEQRPPRDFDFDG